MVKKFIDNATEIVNTSPRISLSVLVMGASAIFTLALNYATYDTRITVLERSALTSEARSGEIVSKTDALNEASAVSQSRVNALEHEIDFLRERIQRLESQQDLRTPSSTK
jgi:hypothetical protein